LSLSSSQNKVFSNKNVLGASAGEAYQTALEDSSGLGLGSVHGLEGILGGSDSKKKQKPTVCHNECLHI
jgi:hypothetical protein